MSRKHYKRVLKIELIRQMETQLLDKSFAQITKTKRNVMEDVDIKEMLDLILEKLDKQDLTNRMIMID